jgi:probable phosphomutase (TIGR03848 family)
MNPGLLILIRHAENDVMHRRLAGRLPGVHLNRRGRQQAIALARALFDAPIRALYSSPLERALETAEPLARVLGLSVEVRPNLNEVDFGLWQGRTYKQLQRTALWRVLQTRPSQVRFPRGEALEEAQRVVGELEALRREGETIACVTHADVIRLALLHYLNMHLDDMQRLVIAPASLSLIAFQDGQPRVLLVNYRPMLEWPEPPAAQVSATGQGR